MVDWTDQEIEAATERGAARRAREKHALGARYDSTTDRIVIDLEDGTSFSFSPRKAQGLENASPADLSEIEVLGGGFGLHWEKLDVDFTVEGLANGIFGTAAYMARRAESATKSAAAGGADPKHGRSRKAG